MRLFNIDDSYLIHLQTVQDYLSEQEKIFLVLVDEDGNEVTLPSRIPIDCFNSSKTNKECQECYNRCINWWQTKPTTETINTCYNSQNQYILKTSIKHNESDVYLIAGRCNTKKINSVQPILEAFYNLTFAPLTTNETVPTPHNSNNNNNYNLTQQELIVLEHLANGLSNKDIGKQLFLSSSTVKTHIYHIFSKLNVKNRTEASLLALREGLVNGN